MPRVPKSRFVNRVALRKAIRGINTNAIRGAFVPHYNRWADEVRNTAKIHAPKKTGRLRGNIRKTIRIKNSALRKGQKGTRMGTFTIGSSSIQDAVIYHGIPDQKIVGKEITKRSRKWRGRTHRPKPAGNFAEGGGKARANRYNGRDWAFGKRNPNKFMNKGRNSHDSLAMQQRTVAKKIGRDITKWIATEFRKNMVR